MLKVPIDLLSEEFNALNENIFAGVQIRLKKLPTNKGKMMIRFRLILLAETYRLSPEFENQLVAFWMEKLGISEHIPWSQISRSKGFIPNSCFHLIFKPETSTPFWQAVT